MKVAAMLLALVAAAVLAARLRGRCEVCDGWLCPIAVAGTGRSD